MIIFHHHFHSLWTLNLKKKVLQCTNTSKWPLLSDSVYHINLTIKYSTFCTQNINIFKCPITDLKSNNNAIGLLTVDSHEHLDLWMYVKGCILAFMHNTACPVCVIWEFTKAMVQAVWVFWSFTILSLLYCQFICLETHRTVLQKQLQVIWI